MRVILWAAASAWALAGAANAADIKVLASGAIKDAYEELAPAFEKASGHKLVTTWAGTVDIKKRIGAGEVFDLVVASSPTIDDFVKQGIVAGSRVDLAKSGVGVAVKAGARKIDIGSSDAIKKALLAAQSIGMSTGPSGVYLEGLFQRMGIADQIKGKLKTTPPGVPVGELIAKGEVEFGFQQVSELIAFPGVDYIGPLPADIQQITVFSGGVHAKSAQADAAKALMTFIRAPAASATIKKSGMEPG